MTLLNDDLKAHLLKSENKAFATTDKNGRPNVVPVSSIFIVKDKVILVDYFMNKTRRNIIEQPYCALTCWTGTVGRQIHGEAYYTNGGEIYEEVADKIAEDLYCKRVIGILVIQVQAVYDISVPD